MIIQGEETLNYGNFMMLLNCIHYSAKALNYECEFFVRLHSFKDEKRIKRELDNKKIILKTFLKKEFIFQKKERNKVKNLFNKIFVFKCRLFDDLFLIKKIIQDNHIDKVFVLGGDNFNEGYKGWAISTNLFQIKIISMITKVFLISQTIGPFYSWRKKFSKYCFKNVSIYCRDYGSVKYLKKEIGLRENIFSSSDLAFLDLPNQNKKNNQEHLLKKNSYVTLVPSGLFGQYCSSFNEYVGIWEQIIKEVLIKKELLSKKILLLPHVLNEDELKIDDMTIIKELKKRFRENERVKVAKGVFYPSEARSILGNGFFTVTGRMHAAISSFQKGVPALSLSYSVKYSRIIGGKLGIKELVIEANSLNKNTITKIVSERMSYLIRKRTKIISKIGREVGTAKKEIIGSINQINNS